MTHQDQKLLQEILHFQRETFKRLDQVESTLHRIEQEIARQYQPLATSVTFKGDSMNPTEAGQTQVFTGTLSPAGSVLATDAVATITSNDPAVSPSLDSTQLIVSVTYPAGWVESTTTPLEFAYATTSASTGQALSATITPSAPPPPAPVLATSIGFAQTT